jgi:Cu2+-exporting ATPase
VVHLAALFTAIGWLAAGAGWHQAILTAIAVLIITCPCALGLAVPTVQVTAAGILLKRGLLVKDGSALERLAEIDRLVFDKTGTLTMGRPQLAGAMPLVDADFALAAGLAQRSAHPLSRALAAEARARGVVPAVPETLREIPGAGVEGVFDGETVRLGRPDWAGAATDAPDAALLQLAFRRGADAPVLLTFADPLRPDAMAAIARLQARGLPISILSGDRHDAVRHVADALQIAEYAAGLSPADKVAAIERMQAAGHKVLVVGDGLNDAPALAAGHASIAPSTASDAGQTAADMLFMGDSLMAVPVALDVAVKAGKHVRQNFAAAIGYNLLAVPIAMAGLATPLIAAIAMSTSSILVVLNALRLRWASGA